MKEKEKVLEKIKDIAVILNQNYINYIIGASGALLLHGLDVLPGDIDIIIDTKDLNMAKTILAGFDCEIHTFPIYTNEVCEINIDGIKVKVNNLEAEYKYYLKRKGESEKVDNRIKMIKNKLDLRN